MGGLGGRAYLAQIYCICYTYSYVTYASQESLSKGKQYEDQSQEFNLAGYSILYFLVCGGNTLPLCIQLQEGFTY